MKIEHLQVAGPAGSLEAVLNLPPGEQPEWAAVVCHPHPLFGGTLHNKVVFHVARALSGLGWPVLRFNYRGVGHSTGHLPEEQGHPGLQQAAGEDLAAALDWVTARFPGARICGAGFSFGAEAALRLAPREPRFERLLLVGTPAGTDTFADVFGIAGTIRQPKLFVQGTADQFGALPAIERLVAGAAPPKRLITVPGSGHFFEGHLDELRRAAGQIRLET